MKLDVNVLRYLSKDEFRVLTAVEMGQKNHEIVPMPLIDSISGLKHGGAYKCIRNLLKHKLVHHEGKNYDGYRLTYMGYDFLAIRSLTMRGHISGVGRQIGVGKESDIYEVMNDEGEVFALKLHRLGRTSFRAVKNQRDYLGRRTNYSWLYLSRLSALKEFAFMKALGEHGFPVPQAIDSNRHAVLMTLLDARPMVQVTKQIRHPAQVFLTCMELISRLAGKGLIHCDFNEFNLLLSNDTQQEVTLIDFPQMVSVSHSNAKELFERDVECIIRFFSKKVGYDPESDPSLPYVRPKFEDAVADVDESLDVALAASGFQRTHQTALESYHAETAQQTGQETDSDSDDDNPSETDENASDAGAGDAEVSHDTSSNTEGAVLQGHSTAQAQDDNTASTLSHETGTRGTSQAAAHVQNSGQSGTQDHSGACDSGRGECESVGEGESGSGSEGTQEDGFSGSEEGESDGSEGRGGVKGTRTRQHRIVTPLGAREVQQAVSAQNKKAQRAAQLQRATRNSTKQVKGKHTKKGKAAGGGGGDFGGW